MWCCRWLSILVYSRGGDERPTFPLHQIISPASSQPRSDIAGTGPPPRSASNNTNLGTGPPPRSTSGSSLQTGERYSDLLRKPTAAVRWIISNQSLTNTAVASARPGLFVVWFSLPLSKEIFWCLTFLVSKQHSWVSNHVYCCPANFLSD